MVGLVSVEATVVVDNTFVLISSSDASSGYAVRVRNDDSLSHDSFGADLRLFVRQFTAKTLTR